MKSPELSRSGVALTVGASTGVVGGVGAIILASLASKIPGLKTLNPRALTAVRVTASSLGGAVASPCAIFVGVVLAMIIPPRLRRLKNPGGGDSGREESEVGPGTTLDAGYHGGHSTYRPKKSYIG